MMKYNLVYAIWCNKITIMVRMQQAWWWHLYNVYTCTCIVYSIIIHVYVSLLDLDSILLHHFLPNLWPLCSLGELCNNSNVNHFIWLSKQVFLMIAVLFLHIIIYLYRFNIMNNQHIICVWSIICGTKKNTPPNNTVRILQRPFY